MDIEKKLVGQAIARLRVMRGLTQSELNERLGMSTIQHIEQGRNTPSFSALNDIARALDVPAACIMLLGSNINEDDGVLSSLHSLLEQALGLEVQEGAKTKLTGTRKGKPSGKSRRGDRKKGVATAKKKKPKRQVASS
ncbi:MAG: XRE family transcriptional regulator [Planctomycetota bacterium]|nr:MAG: XRE family transcriptional regulator [Planctomycetota bacterium]REJ95304.1 MAG: XRE family transcriptional regulator [Planctomycetota bacterium]REK24254.1 MAG: XRE family transcriptional regulator [Planctomycetota bacterium]REK28761.1 MAG: XRE family transcriptional regulator [Planctomycetota bacterium]